MDEKRFALILFGIILLVALIGIIIFCTSTGTGALGVRASITQPSPIIREVPISRAIPVDVVEKTVNAAKITYFETCCMWQDNGMLFHISPAAVKYMKFHPIKVGTDESFNKNDLEYITKPSFYNENKCVAGGTMENHQNSKTVCIESYKGIKMLPQAGLICVEGRWWLSGNICPLSVPDESAAVPQ